MQPLQCVCPIHTISQFSMATGAVLHRFGMTHGKETVNKNISCDFLASYDLLFLGDTFACIHDEQPSRQGELMDTS